MYNIDTTLKIALALDLRLRPLRPNRADMRPVGIQPVATLLASQAITSSPLAAFMPMCCAQYEVGCTQSFSETVSYLRAKLLHALEATLVVVDHGWV